MIVQNFQKFHNKQLVTLCIQQTDWALYFQTHPPRVSVPEQFAK